MGRLVDFYCEIAAEAEDGLEGLTLSPETRARLDTDWSDEDIDDTLQLVAENLRLDAIAEAADSLSAHLVELLGSFENPKEARLSPQTLAHLVRRVDYLEELLAGYREGSPVERGPFDRLTQKLAKLDVDGGE
jgi:hypothetical protein